MKLSDLTQPFDLPSNPLYQLRNQLIKDKKQIIDLVSGNVNTQGILFPQMLLKKAMESSLRAATVYRPDPLGQPTARKAISRYYESENIRIPMEQIVVTPGTSLSYFYAFKLLANPGDEVLCPCPSYPLFDAIAALAGITLVPYPLKEAGRWEINFERLESLISPRTKAIILISPHNPTGAVATEDEIRRLAALATANGLALISDEVFSPFLFGQTSLPRPAATSAPLVLTLNGLSKMLALPGMKIGWMAVTGDASVVEKSLNALVMISDTFLPVNEAAQHALPMLLGRSKTFQRTYLEKITQRLEMADELVKDLPHIRPEGGFFTAIKLEKKGANEEEMALRLLRNHRILVHPGYFYDMEGQHLVLSFVSRLPLLRKTLTRIAATIGEI